MWCGVCVWCVRAVCACGVCVWCAACGVCVWCVCVVLVCGVRVVCACGVCVWCLCVRRVRAVCACGVCGPQVLQMFFGNPKTPLDFFTFMGTKGASTSPYLITPYVRSKSRVVACVVTCVVACCRVPCVERADGSA